MAGGAADLDLVRWFAARMRRASDLGRLGALLGDASRALGFRYHALVDHGDLSTAGLVITNYPEAWQKRYAAQRLDRHDPVQRACARTAIGFGWRALPALISLGARERALLGESRRFGLGTGFTVPLHMPGARAASCSFAVEPGGALPADRLFSAQLLASLAGERARRLGGARQRPPIALSPRQRQCVAGLATGLTDRGIARRLGLSEETVTNYLNAARRRFGLATRSQLLGWALRDGLIGFDALDGDQVL